MATELGKAYVQIIPSAKGISNSIRKQIQGESENAGKAGGVIFGDRFKNMASKVLKTGMAAVGAVTTASLFQGAKLEQSLGGVETLFKSHANTVVNNARQAYRTAGISANEYMENVTSFSASLLQSLGGNTKKAADVSNMAMIDMADNMNKMGTPLRDIQNAYQGFAKQNYTIETMSAA